MIRLVLVLKYLKKNLDVSSMDLVGAVVGGAEIDTYLHAVVLRLCDVTVTMTRADHGARDRPR